MNDYDFATLNDKEFENIAIDLISRDRNKRFERFKVGKDRGVDGRFFSDEGTEEIIQCKHYLKTGYKGLISSLAKKIGNEKAKVMKLNPEKYIFITSLPLSRIEKQELQTIFEPYIKKESDIYGQEDLNDLLKNNSDIEENHYKLWISSTTVLQRIFNNAIKGRSEFELDDIKDKIKYYVVTKNHNNALKKLEESHILIIAGEPGIGKTTLAEQLSLSYIEKGFEFCVIGNTLNEAEAIFERDKKQIFYFDDFLGSNYLEALESHKDSHIMKFIARIKRDKNKRFILTSRTNIFNQSLLISDTFRNKKINNAEFILNVNTLQKIDKAMILYNHIWHSNLEESYINEIYKDKRYIDIIEHKNFTPRLIEFLTDIDKIKSSLAVNYWQDIKRNLDNPSEIWKNTFDKQSDGFMRCIVVLTVFNGNYIEENKLKNAYNSYIKLAKLQNSSYASKEFVSTIEVVVKYFLNRTKKGKIIEYSLFNPSIADFVINNHIEKLRLSILSLQTLKSINILENFYRRKEISENLYNETILELYRQLDINQIKSEDEADYTIKLFDLLLKNNLLQVSDKKKIITFYQKIIDSSLIFSLLSEFITHITSLNIVLNDNNNLILHLLKVLLNDLYLEDINSIIGLAKHFNISNKMLQSELNITIEAYLTIALQERLNDLEVDEFTDDELTYQYDEEGEIIGLYDVYIDTEEYLREYIDEIDIFTGIDINTQTVIYNTDIGQAKDFFIQTFLKKMGFTTSYFPNSNHTINASDNIDNLFER